MHTPGAFLPDTFFTPAGTSTHRLVYRGSVIQARGCTVWGVTGCICGCGRNLIRLMDGRTLAHSSPNSLKWEERPAQERELEEALAEIYGD